MRGAIGVTVGLFLLVVAGPATAAEPPLVFAETSALQTTCAKLAGGVNVTIRNETAAKRRVHLVPVELKDSAGAGASRDVICGGLKVKVAPVIAGGRGVTATVRAKKKWPGGFSGSLLLFASKGRVTRRDLSISKKAPVTTLEAKPLVESETVKLGESDRGPIWIPVDGPASDLPRAATQNDLTVGAVSGNGTAAVVYGGRRALNGSAARVKLELDSDGLDPGAYKGTIDLNQGDDEKGTVELEIKVAACGAIAAALLLLGILAALLLQRLNGKKLPLIRLRRRIRDLRARHDKSLAKLKAAAGARKWGEFAIGDIASLQEGLEEQLSGAAERVALQIDKKVLEGVESAIAVVEAQIDLLKEIPKHAEDLEAELGKLSLERPADPRPLPGADAPQSRPSLDAEVRKSLQGRSVRAEMLKPLIEEIDARAKQVLTLQGLQGRLTDLRRARRALDRLKDRKELRELDKKLNTVRYLLWTARTAEDLDTAAEEIQGAAKLTAALWDELPDSPPAPSAVLRHATASGPLLAEFAAVEAPLEAVSEETAVIETLEVPPGASASPTASAPAVPDTPPAPPLDAGSTEREVNRAFWAQWVAIVVAALVAVATGLILLYVPNETWGSYWDYLAALIWGLGAQATVSALATSVDVLGPLGLRRG